MIQLELIFRRPSQAAREAMCQSALNLKHVPGGRYEEVSAAEESVAEKTGHGLVVKLWFFFSTC